MFITEYCIHFKGKKAIWKNIVLLSHSIFMSLILQLLSGSEKEILLLIQKIYLLTYIC